VVAKENRLTGLTGLTRVYIVRWEQAYIEGLSKEMHISLSRPNRATISLCTYTR